MGAAQRAKILRYLAAALAFASQGIHLWALIGQIAVAMLPGAFFFLVAVGQGLLGASLLFGGVRWTARLGVLLNASVVFVFLLTLTVSSPQFFEPVRPPVEGLGTAATFIEAALVVLLVRLRRSVPPKKHKRRVRWGTRREASSV
jgi:hypothetical protein